MRVALLAPLISALRVPQVGGVATLMCDLTLALLRAGVDVDLFAARGSHIDGLRIVDTGIDPDSLATTLLRPLEGPVPPAVAHQRQDKARAAYRQAYDLIAQGGYDVVHSHAFDGPAIEEALALEVPVVHSLHLPPQAAISAALTVAARAPRPPVIAAISAPQGRAWSASNRVHVVLPAGVPVATIPWSDRSSQRLLVAGRLSPEKGVLDAIEIARGSGRELLIAGGRYDPDYADAVERAATAAGGVTLTGDIGRTELWDIMADSAALLFSIRWEEPYGLVVAEAQAAGCPVIAFNRGAMSDIVVEGLTGAVVAPGDIEAARRAVAGLDAYDRTACRRHAEDHLDIGPMIDAHLALYERLAAPA